MQLQYKNYYLIVLFSIIFYFLFNTLNIQKQATLSLIILVFFILIFYKKLFIFHEQNMYKFNINSISFFMILFLLFFTFISQNVFLNYETVDWDVSSYLVAAQDINKGNIPNENQWESKGPLLFYVYNILSLAVSKNFVLFKLFNDLILFVISIILFFSILKVKEKAYFRAFFSSLLFILLMSQAWAIGEYSELYSLLFLSIANYFALDYKLNYKNIFIVGLLLSLATLINQGTVLFILPYFLIYYKKHKLESLSKIFSIFLLGLIIPHLLSLLLYISRDLLNVYLATYIYIPLGYIDSNYANFYELKVFLRTFYEYIEPLYFALISLVLFSFISIFKKISLLNNIFFELRYLNIFFSFLFYFIGSHNYYHHLIFSLYFLTFLFLDLEFNSQAILVYSFIIISIFVFVERSAQKSILNITNIDETFNQYPLNNLAKEIDSYFQDDYTVLALDYVLVLYYLDKENYTYIVHPSNHFEEFIVSSLSDINIINKNYIENILLYEEPDVIICSQTMIIRGIPTTNTLYNCQISDYRKNYFKLDTDQYRNNPNLNYYKDPYKELSVFIKKDN